jgi:predicted glycogen debranching enzyme
MKVTLKEFEPFSVPFPDVCPVISFVFIRTQTFLAMDTSDVNSLLDFDHLHQLEYVEANGLGGYASGTFSGAHSRKYHGVLVAALKPPVDRVVIVSKLDETILLNDIAFELGCNQFPGTLYPTGFKYISGFKRDIFPEWLFKVKGITIRKTIAAVYGENTTLVLYEVLEAPEKFTFLVQPFYASRGIHYLTRANSYFGEPYIFEKGVFQTMNYQGCPEFFISVPKATFEEQRSWYHNFEYQQELVRGVDFREDLYTHGKFSITLRKGSRLGIIVSLDNPAGKDVFRLFREEKKRREVVVKEFESDPSLRALALAADQFIVKRDDGNTIIAGYPWFTDWGRDTMISLPGLCLVTGKFKEAKRILQKFAEHISEGMIPNRFPDSGEQPEYNTIDATLWFFYAICKYYQYTKDKLFVKVIVPALRDIIDFHYRGTRYNIKVDPDDELLAGGAEGTQLTWMDAKIGDWVVTPRRGKPVEVNALWYNALRSMQFLLEELNYHGDAELYESKAAKVHKSFNQLFWNEKTGCLFDFIDGANRCEDIRPNQLYSMSLPFPVLKKDKASSILRVVNEQLVTPRGLRSLSPLHSDYRAIYEGNPITRDAMYHQGPVWSHLAGPYIDALFFANGEKARSSALVYLKQILENLHEAGLGTISEIFDADKPHKPRGCFAQAWSVGELLRVSSEHNLLDYKEKAKITKTPFEVAR